MTSRSDLIFTALSSFKSDMTGWRRDIHQHPEPGFQEKRTSAIVAKLLKQWGDEVHEELARTGVVGKLSNGSSDRAIGLRADMDALRMQERNELSIDQNTMGNSMAAATVDTQLCCWVLPSTLLPIKTLMVRFI